MTVPDSQPPVFPRVAGTGDTGDQPSSATEGSIFTRAAETPVAPVESVAGPEGRSGSADSRFRWLIAAAATIAVVVLIGGVFLALSPRVGSPSVTAQYAPADTIAYVEARLDMPGDQRANLAVFMSHFPGFADPQAFERKIDEMLEQAVGSSGAGLNWSTDVEPWFGGHIAGFSSTLHPGGESDMTFAVALTVKDRAALDQALSGKTADATAEDHHGYQVWTMQDGLEGQPIAFTATDEVLLIGSGAAQVKAALDVRDNRTAGLADNEFYLQQLAELSAEYLASFYFDGRAAALPLPEDLPADLPEGMPDLEMLRGLMGGSAGRVVGELRAESDHLAVVARTERPADAASPPLPANRSTDLAEKAPADALLYVEIRDVGQRLGYLIETALAASASPGTGAADSTMIEQMLGAPLDEYFGFVTDAGLSVGGSSGQLEAGIVANVTDEVIAEQRLERLMTLVRSMGAFGGEMTVDEQQRGDATIYVINLGGTLGSTPFGSISITVHGGHLYAGIGNFVAEALDRTAAESLAARDDFRNAVAEAGASNAGLVFADIPAALGLVESTMNDEERAKYAQEMQPFLAPLSHLVVVTETDGSVSVSNAFLFVE